MKTLFKSTQNIDGKMASYDVSFYDGAYRFQPADSNTIAFSLRREADEWRTNDTIDAYTLDAATSALEQYLLSQH